MRRTLRFLAVLVLGIGALTWIAYVSLSRTTQLRRKERLIGRLSRDASGAMASV